MSELGETFAGGTGTIASFGSANPAVMAFLQATLATPNLPSLNFSQAADVQAPTGGSIDRGGIQLG